MSRYTNIVYIVNDSISVYVIYTLYNVCKMKYNFKIRNFQIVYSYHNAVFNTVLAILNIQVLAIIGRLFTKP